MNNVIPYLKQIKIFCHIYMLEEAKESWDIGRDTGEGMDSQIS